ncbi:MAG: ABC transporter ATP-binding protein, partial [Acidobacteriaceae bacterium]
MPAAEAQPRKDSAPRSSSEPRTASKPASVQQDDDVVGKAYDSRLMGRLIRYLFPYKWACIASIVAIVLKASADVLGPYLT